MNLTTPIISNFLEVLTCPICLELLRFPIMEMKNQHIFCQECIISSILLNKPVCPLCKESLLLTGIEKCNLATKLLESIKVKCEENESGCNWSGLASEIPQHQQSCEIIRNKNEVKLSKIITEMKKILDLEINPHLKNSHKEIYENHVKDWNWLEFNEKDWKWWWWCNKPWWNNTPCLECNILWHNYENDIDSKDSIRRKCLKKQNSFSWRIEYIKEILKKP